MKANTQGLPRLVMLAGGVVQGDPHLPSAMSAYVATVGTPTVRVFRVRGPLDTAHVEELELGDHNAAFDLVELEKKLHRDLEPVVRDLKQRGGAAGVSTPDEAAVCDLVRAHLLAAAPGERDA